MLSKPKTITYKAAKKKAWDAFSIYIRRRDAKRDELLLDGEKAFCITCGKPYPAFGSGCLQAGHFIGGRNNQVLFDERQVFAQCYNCNINLKGNWVPYRKKMVALYGEEVVADMENTHGLSVKYSVPDLLELEAKYKRLTEEL
jgi:hypothetical protein